MEYKVDGNHIEIYFTKIPDEKVRETLKICGWRWYPKKKCWRNIYSHENLLWTKALKEGLNPKEDNSNPLLNKDRKIFGMVDLIVRSNSFFCNQHHKLEDMVGEVEVVDKNGNVRTYLIPIVFCESCNTYYVLENVYLELKKKGCIRCEILSFLEYKNGNKPNNGSLNEMSPLRKWGYTVSQNAGYSDVQRRGILEDILDNKIMSKDEVLSYLSFFIRLNHKGSDRALEKWRDDMTYISNYKLGTSKKVKIGKITICGS